MEIAIGIIVSFSTYLYLRGRALVKKRERIIRNTRIGDTYKRFGDEMFSMGDYDRSEFWHTQAIKKYNEN